MQTTNKKRSPISTINSIAYFIAGTYIIQTVIISNSYENTLTYWFIISVSSILFLIAFIHVLSMFTFLYRFFNFIRREWAKLLLLKPNLNKFQVQIKSFYLSKGIKHFTNLIPLLLLFVITYTQVTTIWLDHFTNSSPLLWLSSTYSILLVLSILYLGIITTSVEQKLTLLCIFTAVSFYILLRDDFTTEKINFLSISFRDGTLKLTFLLSLVVLLAVSTFASYSKERTQQLAFKNIKK